MTLQQVALSTVGARSVDVGRIFQNQKLHHPVVKKTTAHERIRKLKLLRNTIYTHQKDIEEALHADFRKGEAESKLTEIFTSIAEINDAIRHLPRWMRAQKAATPLSLIGSSAKILYEPKGVVLIIAPWNYPFSLTISPLVAAVAAGNCAVLKPSEMTPHTSSWLKRLIAEIFDESEVAVVEGDAAVTQELLKLPFDHFFFTGSPRVGKIIMKAAAEHLSSVTLELGGKSPVIIDRSADFKAAAERILWGKFINAGQTCIAPDYVLVPESLQRDFVEEAKRVLARFYGETEDARRQNPDFCRIISLGHFLRIKGLVEKSLQSGARAEAGAVFDDNELYIAPTLLTGVTPDMAVMGEEIFGPVLPILTYRSLDEAYSFVASRDKPLALYVFGRDRKRCEDILKNTTAGGSCVNSTVLHYSNPNLPFGGVGVSGFGSYHGIYGFKAFSHERSVLTQGRLNSAKFFFPPYNRFVLRLIRWATRFLP